MSSWICKNLNEEPISEVLGQKQLSCRTEDKHLIGGPGSAQGRGARLPGHVWLGSYLGLGKHDTEQSIILRKAEILTGHTKKVMTYSLPYLVEKVPRRAQRCHDGRFIFWNTPHACFAKSSPCAVSMYSTPVTAQEQVKGKQLPWNGKKRTQGYSIRCITAHQKCF